MGELQRRIDKLEDAHKKLAEAVPSSENVLLRARVIEALAMVTAHVEEMRQDFPEVFCPPKSSKYDGKTAWCNPTKSAKWFTKWLKR